MSYDPLSSGQNAMPAAAPSDASANTAYRVTLPEFEGPLDLLLHLCQTHELDILNISIAFVAQKYIEYLELMEGMSVEIAADYLVMAAHLAYLKSRELVPSPEPIEAGEDGEEPIDPREELIRRLLEYQKYKHAAEDLGNRPIEGRNVFVRGVPLAAGGEAGLAEHSVWKLLEHWAQILEKAKPKYTHDVVVDRMSITDRINQVVDMLESGKGRVRFEDLLGDDLPEAELRHKIVVSLLAVLELARLRVIRVLQEEATGTFFLARVEGAALDEARNLTVTSANVPDGATDADQGAAGAAEHADGLPQAQTGATEALAALVQESQAWEQEADGPEGGEQSLEALAQELEAEAAGLEASNQASELEAAGFQSPGEEVAPEVVGGEVPPEDPALPVEVSTEGTADEVESALTGVGEIVLPEAEAEDVTGDAIELPSHDVMSASFPASSHEGEEVTDGQTQEEQREDTDARK